MTNSHPNGVLYCEIMEQIKWRIDEVQKTFELVKFGQHYLSNLAAAEFCLLQLRMVCELVAIGCIAANTDIPQTNRLQKMWNAGIIIGEIEKLKPEFFPKATKDVIKDNGIPEMVEITAHVLTITELKNKYNFFGGLLHAGTFRAKKSPKNKTYDFSILERFVLETINLLNCHIYHLYNRKKIFRVIMNNVSDGRVWYNEFELIGSMK